MKGKIKIYTIISIIVVISASVAYYFQIGRYYYIDKNNKESVKSVVEKLVPEEAQYEGGIEILKVETTEKYLAVLFRAKIYPDRLIILPMKRKKWNSDMYLPIGDTGGGGKYIKYCNGEPVNHLAIYGGDNSDREAKCYKIFNPKGVYVRELGDEDYFLDIYTSDEILGDGYVGRAMLYDKNDEDMLKGF